MSEHLFGAIMMFGGIVIFMIGLAAILLAK